MRAYPVHLEVTSPERFDRLQLLVRLLLAVVLGWIGLTMHVVIWGLYLVLPVAASIAISSTGKRYLEEVAPRIWRVIAWLLAVSAYMMLLVDRFPVDDDSVHVDVAYCGHPTSGSALLRLLTSIPSGLVLAMLWFLASILGIWGTLTILISRSMPGWLLRFQRGVLRWQARLVAYHASMVDQYPPFSFNADDGHKGAIPATAA